MAMPEPPWASGKGGSAGDFRGAPKGSDFGKGRGSGAGGPTWVEGGSHRSGYKLRITGFPPAAVQPLTVAWITHWLGAEWGNVDPRKRTMSGEALVEATVDVNWNHAAQSGGGRGLGSREGAWCGGGNGMSHKSWLPLWFRIDSLISLKFKHSVLCQWQWQWKPQ